jgi:hypothetical protein
MFAATVALGLDQITGRFTLILLTVAVGLGGCALLGAALFFLTGGDLASAWHSLRRRDRSAPGGSLSADQETEAAAPRAEGDGPGVGATPQGEPVATGGSV